MAQSLRNFHFDQDKSGRILNGWAKDAGVSIKTLGDDTGYTFDTINNSLHGKIKDLSLERVFKIATRTGHSVCEYILLMLQDEDIDFADQIHVLRNPDMILVPLNETKDKLPTKQGTALVQSHVFDQNSPEVQAVYRAIMDQAAKTHQANLDRFKTVFEDALKAKEDSHKEHIATMRRVARQRLRWIIILAVILVAFITWFIWDLSHPEIGLIRLKQMGYFGQHIMGLLR